MWFFLPAADKTWRYYRRWAEKQEALTMASEVLDTGRDLGQQDHVRRDEHLCCQQVPVNVEAPTTARHHRAGHSDKIVRVGGVWAVEWCGGGRDRHDGTGRMPCTAIQRKLVDPTRSIGFLRKPGKGSISDGDVR
jgi:hypothetical protein